MIGRRIAGIDAGRFDRVDRLKRLLHFRPAVDPREDIRAGMDERQRCISFARHNRRGNRDGRMDRPEVVRRPAHVSKDGAGPERRDALGAAQDALGCDAAEADPLLVSPLDPGHFDLSERGVTRRRVCASVAISG